MLSAPEGSVIDDAQFFRSIEYRVYEVGGDVGEYQEGRKGYRRQCEHRQKRYPPAELLPHYGGVAGFQWCPWVRKNLCPSAISVEKSAISGNSSII